MKQPFITFKHFKGDFFGGLTAGIVALPLALAFGVWPGMGAAAGLYGPMFFGYISDFQELSRKVPYTEHHM